MSTRNVVLLFVAAAVLIGLANLISCARNSGEHDIPTHTGLAL